MKDLISPIEEFEKLKRYLPKGFTKILAREFSVTDVTVSNSLNGKTKRFDIIKRAIEMARENIDVKNELREFVAEL